MRLTERTDLALRALIFLAVETDGRYSVREIATVLGVSMHNLQKAVQALVKAGFVDARRGKGGGHKLALPAETISVGDVVRAIEPLEPVECWRSGNACALTPSCGLIAVIDDALKQFLSCLDAVPLSRLNDRPMRSQLVRLGVSAAAVLES